MELEEEFLTSGLSVDDLGLDTQMTRQYVQFVADRCETSRPRTH